jgi:antitoxin MazE
MKTTVQKWGNSYAMRIPKSFIKEMGLKYRTDVELTLEDGKLVIQPIKQEKVTLDDLLAQVTKKNLHGAEETGASMGNEAW